MRGFTGVVCALAGSAVSAAAVAGPPQAAGSARPDRVKGGSVIDAFPLADNFDSYPDGAFPCTGAGCAGPNGWGLWYLQGPLGPNPGSIVSGNAHSGTKALRLSPESDIVQAGLVTSGQWTVKAYSYFPGSATASTDVGYFIALGSYNGAPAPADEWTITVTYDGAANVIRNWFNAGQTLPLIRDQWVEIRAEIDLDTNLHSIYYGGQPLFENQAYANAGTAVALACLDLYSGGVDGMMYDTVSVEQGGGSPCYANCDESTTAPVLNVADFTCFLQRFAANESYANCDESTTAPVLNVADFTCFLQEFAAGCP